MAVNEFNISDIPDYAAKAKAQYLGRQALEGKVTGYETDYLDRYRRAIMGQENYDALAKRIGEELGLPQAQRISQQLGTSLRNVPYMTTAAARGFDVNENQRQRIIAQRQAELGPLATEATTTATNLQAQLGQRMGYAQAQYEKELLPYAYEKDFVSERTARELTGYDTYMQAELDGLIKKAEQGIQLSEGEKSRALQLSLAEMEYKRTMDSIKAQGEQARLTKKAPTDLASLYSAIMG